MQKQFNSNGSFWSLVISIEDDEILFFKNSESEPFYYFSFEQWVHDSNWIHSQMKYKTWFTDEMFIFINSQIDNP